MLESATPPLEFEVTENGTNYRLQFMYSSSRSRFWLQRDDLKDWLAIIEDYGVSAAWQLPTQVVVRKRVNEILENRQLGRALFWNDGNEQWLLLWKNQFHAWLNPRNGENANFESQTDWYESDFWTQPNEWFRQRFIREWEKPHCDAREALGLLRTSYEERRQLSEEWKKEVGVEAERIIRAAMQVEFKGKASLEQYAASPPIAFEWIAHSPISARLQILLEAISKWNMGNAKLNDVPRYAYDGRCGLFEPINREADRFIHNLHIFSPAPTMHEKVEAHYFLLSWIREHAPQLVGDWT
ncbi:hypothetical protein EON83_21050 [bacterium]|nr:MAG: hypothetical protein EON83_21050 [bacterium]